MKDTRLRVVKNNHGRESGRWLQVPNLNPRFHLHATKAPISAAVFSEPDPAPGCGSKGS